MKQIFINNPMILEEVCACLASGGLIIYPTETSYGLGADATNPAAIERLLEYKGNRLNKALSIAVADKTMAEDYIEMNSTADHIFETLLPGPVTVIAKSRGNVAKKVESGQQTLGIRYSSLAFVSDLVRAFGRPITATSANTSGLKQIFSFEEWISYTPESRQPLIGLFVDAGPLPVRPPSTVVDTTLNNPEVLRQGVLTIPQGATHFESHNPEDTIHLGERLVQQQMDLLVSQPLVVALQGELGAGKTHFVKGMGKALGISETINSPTYTIMREYEYKTVKISGMMYHLDTWRLFEGETVADLGIETKIGPGSVIAIEWQEKAHEWIKKLKPPFILATVIIESHSEMDRTFSIVWEAYA